MINASRSRITPPGLFRTSFVGVLATFVLVPSLGHPAIAGTAEGIAAFEAGNYERARAELKPEAEAGDAKAQLYIGRLYTYGYVGEKNDKLAFQWYLKAAQAGLSEAQAIVGYAFDRGIGVELDDAKAVSWYEKSAIQENASAQRNLGLMYQEGEGIERDYEKSIKWLRKAAEHGDAIAQTELAHTFWMGYGSVNRDREQALEWIEKAAQQDNAKAQYLLCGYLQGLFHQGDDRLVEAFMWCKLSADQGYPGGQQDWEDSTRWFISDAQKIEAALRAAQWAAVHRDP